MSGGVTVGSIAGLGAAVLGTTAGTAVAVGLGAASLYSQYQSGVRAADAQDQSLLMQQQAIAGQETNAKKAAYAADQAFNAANKKAPNTTSLLTGARGDARQGIASTMLTGASGVNPVELPLYKRSLLGA